MAVPEVSQIFGMGEETLKCVVSAKHRNDIASRVGDAWESLATFINISSVDVDDIKEKYEEPLDMRLAMMRRWHELWGSEATYFRLVEGLRQIGRRDLIELLKQKTHTPSASGSKSLLVHDHCMIAALGVLFAIIFVGALNHNTYNAVPIHNISESGTDQQYLTKSITHPSKRVALHHQIVSDCSSPESDLPKIHPLFVGRENDVHQVLHKVARAHIVNINGAPGFGKSTLAIHVGYEVVKNGTSVRYINMEDKLFSIVNQWQKSEGIAKPKFMSKNDVHPGQMTSLIMIKPSRSSLSNNYQTMSSKNENFLEELQKWSVEMKCTNILILDNCDNILISEYRQQFLSLINTLVMRSKFKLHIIIVSQERLLYLDDFDCWTVKELNQSACIEMLDKIAPAIDNETLREVAELVEGCPLALKVIGQLLHIHGTKLMPKLKRELIAILDEASIPKQRFRLIMDVAFERLGILKDCGYVLSLFPGSFDEQAGTAVVQKECLELYFKHSLLNEYSLAYNYRYKLHRLIKEYLQEKVSIRESTTFIIRFRAYYESFLMHATSQENPKSETDRYSLSLELHNLNYLKELLLANKHLSSKELAVLGLLSDVDLIQFEQLYRYYAIYMLNIQEICPFLNNQELCGKMYSTVVRHLYRICKCETVWAYLQNFVMSPCMKYFQCKVASYLHDLDSFGVVHLSQDESSYIDIILSSHCNEGYRTDVMMRNHVIINNEFLFLFSLMSFITGVIFALYGRVFIRNFCMGCTIVMIGIVLCILCACILVITPVLYYYEMAIITTHHQFLRILEVLSKVFCHYAILFIAIMLTTSFILFILSRMSVRIVGNCLITTSIVSLSSILVVVISPSLPNYCCQFIPVCV